MTSNVKISWNQRLGRIGESEIRKRLSYFSNVGDYDTDVGIDFVCDLLRESSPSEPYYVQAKGTQHFDSNWGQSIKKSTVFHWLTRLSPVYLIVYDEIEKECYWNSIEDKRYELIIKMDSSNDTIYINVDKTNILKDGKNANNEFIKKIDEDYGSINLFYGRPVPLGRDYVKQLPGPPRSNLEFRNIKSNIRMSVSSLIQHYMRAEDWSNAIIYAEFMTKIDKSHYNHWVWFGRINVVLGNIEEARKSYEEALRICDRDKKWPREDMRKLRAGIQKEMEENAILK